MRQATGEGPTSKRNDNGMASSDEELVARSMGGDLDSFNQLVLRWERPIYALAYRVIGRDEDARDVAQETFLRRFAPSPGSRARPNFHRGCTELR